MNLIVLITFLMVRLSGGRTRRNHTTTRTAHITRNIPGSEYTMKKFDITNLTLTALLTVATLALIAFALVAIPGLQGEQVSALAYALGVVCGVMAGGAMFVARQVMEDGTRFFMYVGHGTDQIRFVTE